MPLNAIRKFLTPPSRPRRFSTRELIRQESEVGKFVFGPVPAGHNRDFFCLDRSTWVWHEEWKDANGKQQVQTTRYEIRPGAVIKVQDGKNYTYVTGAELQNFAQATSRYYRLVAEKVYGRKVPA